MEVSYLLGEVAELLNDVRLLPQRHKREVGLGVIRLRAKKTCAINAKVLLCWLAKIVPGVR